MNKLKIKIKKASLKDVPILTKFSKETLDYHRKFDSRYKKSYGLERTLKKQLISDFKKKIKYFLLKDNKKPIGYFSYYIHRQPPNFVNEKIGHLQNAFILKKYRKRGLGKMILRHLTKVMHEKKIKELELSVDSKNTLGVKAWSRLGFNEFRKRMVKKI